MSKCNKIRILNETINAKDKSTLITTPKELTNNRERAIVFSFSNFQKESIKCRDFNNTYTPSQLFEPALKEQYHYNEFKDELHIQRIENVLINGYNMKSEKVKQFEKIYFEFQFSDGKRVIGIKIEENDKFYFEYIKGNVKMAKKSGFSELIAFPDLDKKYECETLFASFSARLPDKRRNDIKEILDTWKMEQYDEFELLKRSGAKVNTDTLEFVA